MVSVPSSILGSVPFSDCPCKLRNAVVTCREHILPAAMTSVHLFGTSSNE